MSPNAPTSIRLDDDLRALALAECERLDIDLSRYIRQCVAFRVGFMAAVRAAQEGADLEDLSDYEKAIAALVKIAAPAMNDEKGDPPRT